ncbi:MAG: hypothetical protein ACE5G2_04330 [Candidatus Krumholzibacteriia bacterium]
MKRQLHPVEPVPSGRQGRDPRLLTSDAAASRSRPATDRQRSWLRPAPWNLPFRATAVHLGENRVDVVSGDSCRGSFVASRWLSVPLSEAALPGRRFASRLRGHGIRTDRLCVLVPRTIASIRYFHLPSADPDELQGMVFHQLSLALPVDVSDVCWMGECVDRAADGSSIVMTHVVRRDRLDAHLRRFHALGLDVEMAVPEGHVLARLCARSCGPARLPGDVATAGRPPDSGAPEPPIERSALFLLEGRFHLVVARGDVLVFHHSFGAPIPEARSLTSRGVNELLLAATAEIHTARSEFAGSLGRQLPEPLLLFPETWADPQPVQARELFASRLADRFAMQVRCGPQHGRASGDAPAAAAGSRRDAAGCFALALAAAGCTATSSLVPAADAHRRAGREKARTLVQTGLLLLSLLAAGALFVLGDLAREHRKLEGLRQKLAATRQTGEELAAMQRELTRLARRQASAAAPLRALASVQANAPRALKLEQLGYTKGRGATMLGRAPDVASVMDFSESLSSDPLWAEVKVLGIHRAGTSENAAFRFEIEASLRVEPHAGSPPPVR